METSRVLGVILAGMLALAASACSSSDSGGTGPTGGSGGNAITPDTTGLAGWTPDNIVTVLHQGVDKDGHSICPPMPVGPQGAFGGMSSIDALDIANYLLSIAPKVNDVPKCEPSDGGPPPADAATE